MRIGVPVVDISADPAKTGAQLDEICRTTGFFQVTGHGIDDGVSEPAWTMATRFFNMGPAGRPGRAFADPGEAWPRYEPVLAGPHLMGKFRRSVGA